MIRARRNANQRRVTHVGWASVALAVAMGAGATTVTATVTATAGSAAPTASTADTVTKTTRTTRSGPPTTRLAQVSTACSNEIARRVTTLRSLSKIAKVGPSPEHRIVLLNDIETKSNNLTALREDVRAATSAEQVRSLCNQAVVDYRVYSLTAPVVYLVSTADSAGATITKIAGQRDKLSTLLTLMAERGHNVTDIAPLIAGVGSKLDEAKKLTESIGDRLVTLTAADVNAGRAGPVLKKAYTDVRRGYDNVQGAIDDLQRAVEMVSKLNARV